MQVLHLQYLLLNKRVLLSVLKAQPEEDQAQQCGLPGSLSVRVCMRHVASSGLKPSSPTWVMPTARRGTVVPGGRFSL